VCPFRYGCPRHVLSGFSRGPDYARCRFARRLRVLSGSPGAADLPAAPVATPFNLLFRQQAALSLPLHRIVPAGSDGILTVSAIGLAARLSLRARLTLNRLALFRKPWSFGVRASHPHYRYLYLHLLFRTLQSGSRRAFDADRNAPLPILPYPAASVPGLIPDYYPCPAPRPVSCYALFE
jgi:hypothetical protein